MAKIEIFADKKRLLVSSEPNGLKWCSLFVESENSLKKLGSESLKRLRSKCRESLGKASGQKIIMFNEVGVFSVVNLLEPHF
jgi:hypothetical protein